MKDQYFGDQTDYIKYGVLRSLSAAGLDLGIHWAHTPNDGSSDGSRLTYLSKSNEWRHYDPPVFDLLKQSVENDNRQLRVVESENLIPNSTMCFDEWTDDHEGRTTSLIGFLESLQPGSLVFLDPDNGLEVQSTPYGSPASHKYVYLEELASVWQSGHSILLYQHFPRVARTPYVESQLERIAAVTPGAHTVAIITSHVAFLILLQKQHRNTASEALDQIIDHWNPHVTLICRTGN